MPSLLAANGSGKKPWHLVWLYMEKNMESLIYRLRKRAEIRRQIPGRKSVQENKPDRIADLLEEAANRLEQLEAKQPT
jgi:hypothetical protein